MERDQSKTDFFLLYLINMDHNLKDIRAKVGNINDVYPVTLYVYKLPRNLI